jgi:hypothetical protein
MGIYVFYEGPQDKYAEICHYFFANGFLLPPPDEDGVVRVSLILPGEMSPGEEAKLAKLFAITGENYRS